MFKDCGRKIQVLAKVLFFLCIGIGGLAFLFSLFGYLTNATYLEYASVNGGAFGYSDLETAGNTAYAALIVLRASIGAIVSAFIGCLPLYGFGLIVENAERSLAAFNQ